MSPADLRWRRDIVGDRPSGSRFERSAGGGDRPETVDRFTADDLVAVSLLSVNVPPHGAIDLLETRADEFAQSLAEIPHDVEIVDSESIPDDWAPGRSWKTSRDIHGIGWVTAGKLSARKRPRLVPVYDTVVRAAVQPTASFWEALRAELRADDRALHRHLVSSRDEAGIGDDISASRVFDVVVADAVVIPTDAGFRVERWWRDAAGLDPATTWSQVEPAGWGRGAALPARTSRRSTKNRPEVWFLDAVATTPAGVGDAARRAVEAIVEHSGDRLRAAAEAAGRDSPLVASPVVGTGYGGHRSRRGQVISALLNTSHDAARDSGVDVTSVASNRADYSALQHRRRVLARPTGLADHVTDRARDLGAHAARGELASFFGAGVSIAAGLPSWSHSSTELVVRLDSDGDVRERMKDLGPLEQAELIQVALADRSARARSDTQKALGARVASIIKAASARPSLSHALLASMRVREAATTNYDQLYEQAVTAAGGPTDGSRADIDRLPWDRTSTGRPWLLKMHGDVEHPDSIVSSRSSFVHYDNRWKPVGSLVQSLMMTKHLLVVGASMTDDNSSRFAYEVAGLRASVEKHDPAAPEIGTVLHLADDAAFSRSWKGRFDVVVPTSEAEERAATVTPDPSESDDARRDREATERRRAARASTVLLDVVAMHAEREAPHLLDARYVDERGEEAASLVTDSRNSARTARQIGADDAWTQLADALDQFGAGSTDG
ncbi:hypothetical protein OY671_001723 [Metschnikowia pulcherrima]|nr:hypothetical protein OY671_001723 [Metschnikowia pulcherrima]